MTSILEALAAVVDAAHAEARREGVSVEDATTDVLTSLMAVTAAYARRVSAFGEDQFVMLAAEAHRVVGSNRASSRDETAN